MEVGARDNGAAGVGGCGYAPFTFGALGDVYVCENERKEGRKEGRKRLCLPWPYGV